MSIRYIPLTFDNANIDTSARELVLALAPEWVESEGPIELKRFTDGITNTLTKATKKRPGQTQSEADQEAVLLRAFGKGTDVLINRQRELQAHTLLASRGMAPPLLARFDNGLMYRYTEGDVCSCEDLRRPEVFHSVAERLGQWHGSLPISSLLSKNLNINFPLAKDGREPSPKPNMWWVTQQWIEALPTTTEKERSRVETLRNELEWLVEHLSSSTGLDGKDYVFCHCDLLCGNVIIQRPNASNEAPPSEPNNHNRYPVTFIDYEYAAPAPAAFDIANHFAEWAGYECEHTGVPSKSQRRGFLKSYVAAYRSHQIPEDHSGVVEVDPVHDVEHLYQQVDLFRGVPGFYWGIWALIQATISQIDFDYASYAEVRLGEYWGWKGELDGSREREGREMTVRERRWAEE